MNHFETANENNSQLALEVSGTSRGWQILKPSVRTPSLTDSRNC
jgi:hypothetical protein